jgi:carbon-monoxide dehydrogenase medium subunit
MQNFTYHQPGSVEEAAQALAGASDGTLMGGGMTLLPTMKQRLASPSDVVDLGGIAGLSGISEDGGNVVIGAMTSHAEVASNATVGAKIPALAALAEAIGDPQVRHRGTIGGSIANNDPAADYPAGLVGLGATVRTNQREIAADDFFTGLFETALADGEVITAVAFPVPEKAGYAKFPNPASRYAIVGVMASTGPAGTRVAVPMGSIRTSTPRPSIAPIWSASWPGARSPPPADRPSIHGHGPGPRRVPALLLGPGSVRGGFSLGWPRRSDCSERRWSAVSSSMWFWVWG